MSRRHTAVVFWLIVVAVLLIDQVSKFLVRAALPVGSSRPLIADVFHLTHVQNLGAAFGLFPGRQPLFVLVTVVVLVAIAAYWRRSRPQEWPIVIALALVTGGSLGNAYDRLAHGSVTDFFDFTLIDFAVFNVADSAVVVGVGILILWLLLVPEESGAVPAGDAESDTAVGQS